MYVDDVTLSSAGCWDWHAPGSDPSTPSLEWNGAPLALAADEAKADKGIL